MAHREEDSTLIYSKQIYVILKTL